MIATGMDAGLSLGLDVWPLIPLYLSAWEVAGSQLESWYNSWMEQDYSPPLTAEGWFTDRHHPGVQFWTPPPAAALIALKELAQAHRLQSYTTIHVVFIPRLLYQEEWKSRLRRK